MISGLSFGERISNQAAALARRAMQRLCIYKINHIYARELDGGMPDLEVARRHFGTVSRHDTINIMQKNDPTLTHALSYEGGQFPGYALSIDGRVVSLAYFVDRTTYKDHQIWPLANGEVLLAHVATAASENGKGYASALIRHMSGEMHRQGYQRAVAIIWWRHTASQRAFEKAGWRQIGFSLVIKPRGFRELSWRMRIG